MQGYFTAVRRNFRLQFLSALSISLLTLVFCSITANAQSAITSGATWKDTSGNTIEVHGGGMIKVGSTYYWFGEADDGSVNFNFAGINCYSSTNLTNWTYEGDILPPQSSGDLVVGNVVQRPKILYNSSTSTYVMLLHIDNSSYSLNHVGYATSSSVCGTYSYKGSSKPLGNKSYDIGAFEDSNGDGYLLTTDNDTALRIELLASDYLSPSKVVATLPSMEGASMIHDGSYYYVLCSHLTGWAPNDDQYAYATSPSGTWSSLADFAQSGTNTYSSQTSWILPVTGTSGTVYMYMGDRWDANQISDSTYVWLPLAISGTSVSMADYSTWYLNVPAGTWSASGGTPPTTGSYTELISDNSGMCLSAVNTAEGTQLEQATCTGSTLQLWDVTTEGSGYNITNEATGYVADDSGNSKTAGGVVIDWAKNGGTNQEWTFSSNGSGYYTIVNVYSGLCLDVTGASKTSGALIDQWTCNGGTNQLWKQ